MAKVEVNLEGVHCRGGGSVNGSVFLNVSKTKGVRCNGVKAVLKCFEYSNMRAPSNGSLQPGGRMGGSARPLPFSSAAARHEISRCAQEVDLLPASDVGILKGSNEYKFSFSLPEDAPGSYPLEGRNRHESAGQESVQWELKGMIRTYRVSTEQGFVVVQAPALEAVQEYQEYYSTETSIGKTLCNAKSFWFFSGQVQCNVTLNKQRFFLHESDPILLTLEVKNDSTATMRGASLALQLMGYTGRRLGEEETDTSYLGSFGVHQLSFGLPIEDALEQANVLPGESKGFTWPLPIAEPEKEHPSFFGDVVVLEHRLVVTLRFGGFNVPLKVHVPLLLLEPPHDIEMKRGATKVSRREAEAEGDKIVAAPAPAAGAVASQEMEAPNEAVEPVEDVAAVESEDRDESSSSDAAVGPDEVEGGAVGSSSDREEGSGSTSEANGRSSSPIEADDADSGSSDGEAPQAHMPGPEADLDGVVSPHQDSVYSKEEGNDNENESSEEDEVREEEMREEEEADLGDPSGKLSAPESGSNSDEEPSSSASE